MDSRKPLTAGEIEELRRLAEEHRVCGDWTFFEREAVACFLPSLLSMLAQAQTEAAVLSRVIDVMGYSGSYQLIPERLAAMLTPPTDAAVREAVERASSLVTFGSHNVVIENKHIVSLLCAVQSPRLTTEQVDYLRQMDAYFEHTGTDGFRNGLRLYWPEAFAGEVGNE